MNGVIVLDRIRTNRFLGTCTPCNRPTAVELDTTDRTVTEGCAECSQPVTLNRLIAVTTVDVCDPSCMGATGPNCSCGCGGANHGISFLSRTRTHYEIEQAVAKHRAKTAKRAAAAKKAAATKAAKKEANKKAMIDGWFAGLNETEAAAIAWLTAADGESLSSFLWDMRDYVVRFKNGTSTKYMCPLTPRQLEAVVKCHVRELEFAARRAQIEADRAAEAANAKPVPTGNGLIIEGEIVHTKTQDGYAYNTVEHKMLIKGDGWKVWATIPRDLLPTVYNGEEFQAALKALRGRRVRFTANVELGRDGDKSFGLAKRPRKAELIAA